MAKQKIIRVVTCDTDGSMRTRDYDSLDLLIENYEQVGVDDCSTDLSLRGMPVFRGLIGPIPESKTVARYESPEVFEIMTKEWAAQKSRRRRRKSTVPAPAGGAIITGAATSITISVSETV